MFLDRRSERAVLERLLDAVRVGESRALVVHGEPGVGKTALLEDLVYQVPGCRVVRVTGVQSEMELAFAGLYQLCAPMLDRLESLPAHQRDALGTALGLSAGNPPDGFLVGLAVLSLVAEAAREQPLICIVDDAYWVDRVSRQALAFIARRLAAESVALIFAVREPNDVPELMGLPRLMVGGLPDDDARTLLGSALHGPVDERVFDRIVAETRGNPLALEELPRGWTPAELAGGFGLPDALPLPGRIEESFRRRLALLPAGTQRLLLVAAVEPLGDPVLLWRAAERLGIGVEAAAPAAAAGLLKIGARVRFRHPLACSAVYRAASPEERRSAHRALAEATDPEADADRRAWHNAQAAPGPDEDVAGELERSAGRAQARGGLAAACAFLRRATELTPDSVRRAVRALTAAQAAHQAGAPDAALRLLSLAEAGPLDELQRARLELLRAQIAFAVRRGSEVPPLLLKAAKQLEPLDVRLARETYLDALSAAIFAGCLASGGGVLEAAQAARAAPPSPQPPHAPDLLLDGLAVLFTQGYPAATPLLKRALSAFRSQDISMEQGFRWLWLVGGTAIYLWDYETWEVLSTRYVQPARDAGALTVLPLALTCRIFVHIFAGELTEAASLVKEMEAVTEATGIHLPLYGALALAAHQGREIDATELIEATIEEVVSRGEGMGMAVTGWAKALLYNSLGRYEDALAAAEQAVGEQPLKMGASAWALAELIEAATRSETAEAEAAANALYQLTETTRASGTEWALGIQARSHALLSHGPAAESAYREAIDRLGRTFIRVELARAHLIYGEWLRRENRRLDAREQLRSAHEMFTAMGMGAFAQRAARELRATGETARKRTSVDLNRELTAQEAEIARLVREGLSNAEIAARLFISPRTVEWHLSKIFSKLHISSRKQLHR
ncbi:ATP-binding protein [Pseudonocardia xinjiangensis]|uniref:ATP-binding protein n=1 Tax=Pseudonocardia xinjiangensis TaxID=75289 RepID=UPI003D909D93